MLAMIVLTALVILRLPRDISGSVSNRNNELKKIYLVSESFAFLKSNIEFILFETIKNSFNVVDMSFDFHRINHYIIQIHNDVDIQTSRQNSIDEVLKRCKSIDEIEEKYVVFEMIVSNAKCRFSFVFMLDA